LKFKESEVLGTSFFIVKRRAGVIDEDIERVESLDIPLSDVAVLRGVTY
jgi:hypothetical protein